MASTVSAPQRPSGGMTHVWHDRNYCLAAEQSQNLTCFYQLQWPVVVPTAPVRGDRRSSWTPWQHDAERGSVEVKTHGDWRFLLLSLNESVYDHELWSQPRGSRDTLVGNNSCSSETHQCLFSLYIVCVCVCVRQRVLTMTTLINTTV